MDGIPKINHGQEVGNREPQNGWWEPAIKWDANPDAARYRTTYKTLAAIRASHPAMCRGDLKPLPSSDESVAAFARTLSGEPPIIVVINFSPAPATPKLDLSAALAGGPGTPTLTDLLDHDSFAVRDTRAFSLNLAPFKFRILDTSPTGR